MIQDKRGGDTVSEDALDGLRWNMEDAMDTLQEERKERVEILQARCEELEEKYQHEVPVDCCCCQRHHYNYRL